MTMSLVVMVVISLMQGARAAKLTACESAIYFCCDPYSNSLLPLRYTRNHVNGFSKFFKRMEWIHYKSFVKIEMKDSSFNRPG